MQQAISHEHGNYCIFFSTILKVFGTSISAHKTVIISLQNQVESQHPSFNTFNSFFALRKLNDNVISSLSYDDHVIFYRQ